jgi:membrane fusion protein, multidrug efflux system
MDELRDVEGTRASATGATPVADAPQRRETTREAPRAEPRIGKIEAGGGGASPGGPGGPRSNRKPLIIVAVLAVIAGLIGTWYWHTTRNLEDTDDAYTDGRAITVAPRVSGQVVALDINDNQFVHAGQLLLQIDPRDYQAARDQAAGTLEVAKAQLHNAKFAVEIARVVFPARLAAAQAQLASARAAQLKADEDLRRQRSLPRAATTQEAVDQAVAAAAQTAAQVAQAEAQEREAEPVQPNIKQSDAQVSQLEGQIEQAQAQLTQAELNLSYTRVTAPQAGWITKRNIEKGDYVQPGQALLSIVTPDVWVTANFKETELTRLRPGQPVTISVDAYPQLHLTGHVDSIQMGSGAEFTAFPPENATGNYVKIVRRVPVKIDIDHGLDPKLPLPLGISVEPTVKLK